MDRTDSLPDVLGLLGGAKGLGAGARVPSEAEKRWRDLAAATGLPAAGVVGV